MINCWWFHKTKTECLGCFAVSFNSLGKYITYKSQEKLFNTFLKDIEKYQCILLLYANILFSYHFSAHTLEYLTFNILLLSKSQQKGICNWFCTLIH